jgi:hypothetical protein
LYNDVVVAGCGDNPRSADTGILLSFFLGIYGAGYYYYGYMAPAICMTVFGVIWLGLSIGSCVGGVTPGVNGLKGAWFCWGFIMFIMVAVGTLLPNYNEYGIYCPMTCRSDRFMPSGSGVYLPTGSVDEASLPALASNANMISLTNTTLLVAVTAVASVLGY